MLMQPRPIAPTSMGPRRRRFMVRSSLSAYPTLSGRERKMADRKELIRRVDEKASLDFLARMIRFKSYSATPGEAELSRFMVEAMKGIGLDAEQQPVEEGRWNAIGT